MSVTLICLAICAAVALGGKICQDLRNEVTVNNIKYIKPDSGFKNFVGSSYSQTMTVAMSKGKKLCDKYAEKIEKLLPAELKSKKVEFQDMLTAMSDFEGYAYEDATKAITTVEFSNKTGKIAIFNMLFSPVNDEKIKVTTFDITASMEIPASFVVQEMTVKNKFRTKTQQSLSEIPTSLTVNNVVDAISMVLAPCINGAVQMPDDVKELYKQKEQSESPGVNKIPTSFK